MPSVRNAPHQPSNNEYRWAQLWNGGTRYFVCDFRGAELSPGLFDCPHIVIPAAGTRLVDAQGSVTLAPTEALVWVGAFTTYRLASTGAGQLRAMMILMPGPLSTNRDTHPLAGSWNALTDAIGVFADTEVRGGLTAAIDAGQSMLHLEVGEALDSLLARATDQGVRATRQSARGHAADARLLRAYSFLRDRITEPLELGALANVACMSKYHLVRLFARAFSYTPRACQMEMRLALAKSAIMRGASLFRATHDSGFADQSHLTRRLKASLGLTPGALARQCATPWVGGAGIVFHSRPARLVAAAS